MIVIIPILLYHHINNAFANNITVRPTNFQAQMDFLHAAGYRVISAKAAVVAFKNNTPVPPKTVLKPDVVDVWVRWIMNGVPQTAEEAAALSTIPTPESEETPAP